jgi:hypothetical protein
MWWNNHDRNVNSGNEKKTERVVMKNRMMIFSAGFAGTGFGSNDYEN